jgi:hypothetical protein
MKTHLLIIALLCLFVSVAYSQTSWDSTTIANWYTYGDQYPTGQKVYNDIPQFMMLQGPGNMNPGNGCAAAQNTDTNTIPPTLKDFLARQYTYILFDQESFCNRTKAWDASSVTATMTPKYHQEAESLMVRNSSLIVFPYFNFTVMRQAYPWCASVPESLYLHQVNQPADANHRIVIPDSGFYLMDISKPSWQNFYVNWIDSIVTMTAYGPKTYRGIFLDNMTEYPWVDSLRNTQLPNGTSAGWYNNLKNFLIALQGRVGTSIPIVCNSLGLDDSNLNTPVLFGADHGEAIASQVRGGALMEGFHSTASKSLLDSTLVIMNWMKLHDKIFLAASHYARDYDSNLSGKFGLPPQSWGNNDPYPPLRTFYRMQMSFLARFLLGMPDSSPRFGYSYQPGTLLYQFIPYYQPWDEKIGKAVDPNYVDMVTYYKREFSNCISYVNKSESGKTIITLPTGMQLFYFDYYFQADPNTKNIPASLLTVPTLTLNPMEGIVVFKR